jgi:hypothetical protein
MARLARGLAEFSDQYQKALAEAEMSSLAKVRAAAGSDWKAAAWFLERRAPDRWGRRRVEVTGPDGTALEGRVVVFLPDNGRGDGSVTVQAQPALPAAVVEAVVNDDEDGGEGEGG